MRHPPRRQPLLTASPHSNRALLQGWLTTTWTGRLLIAGLITKIVVRVVRLLTTPTSLDLVDRVGSLALVIAGGYLAYRLIDRARRRLLWRVRRKLILSYIFIGVVPILLLVTFFVLGIVLLFFNISSYLVQSRLERLTEQARMLADATLVEIQQGSGSREAILARRQTTIEARYTGASIALVPTSGDPPCGARASLDLQTAVPASGPQERYAGPWAHVEPPRVLPRWVACDGFSGILVYAAEDNALPGGNLHLIARAAAVPEGRRPGFAVIVDLPVNDPIAAAMRDERGIELGSLSLVPGVGEAAPMPGRARAPGTEASTSGARGLLNTVTFLNYTDWDHGAMGSVTLSMSVSIPALYAWLESAQGRIANQSFGQVLLYVLGVVGALLLIIEVVALTMGLALARSITGSVHELFIGTERVRQGDFTHTIAVRAHDQLGDLADSFNSMTASISELLREMAEKKRLEEELRIAREIQMSLLPHGPLTIPGLSVTALCVPAREVGGDYYDFLPLDDHRVGVLIADVSGKGTSAAFYMAELKGLMLSLSRIHTSPRQLLIDANRIIANHLDSRSFITMIYAIVDVRAQTMTCARAGHAPLIYVPAAGFESRRARILTPDGMVLGLKVDHGEKFEQTLQEVTIPLAADDLFVFFTDGISEAMNAADDCFGESRLGRIVEEHGHLSSEELRERILREVESFVGGAGQHDDMTMIILRVEGTMVEKSLLASAVAAPI